MRAKLAILMVVALAIAGTGVYALTNLNGDATDRAVALVPEDAFLYGHVFLKPSVDQRKALRDLLERFDKAPEADEVLDPFFGLIDEGLEQYDMTYEDDVKPWLGDQAALFLTGPETGAALVATDDVEATKEFVATINEVEGIEPAQGSYKGVEYDVMEDVALAFLDDFLVLGLEEDVRSVIDVHGGSDSLEDSAEFAEVEGDVTADRIFSLYLDPGRLAEVAGPAGVPDLIGSTGPLSGVGSLMVAGSLRADAVVVELAGMKGDLAIPPGVVDLASGAPSDAWLAFGLADFGELLRTGLNSAAGASGVSLDALLGEFSLQTGLDLTDDILSWMGDLRFFVSGTGLLEFGGALSIGSSDPATSEATIRQLMALAQEQGIEAQPVEIAGVDGFALPIPGSPQPIVVVPGESVVIAYGQSSAEDALDPDEPLADSERFGAASDHLGAGLEPVFYLDIDAVQQLVENFIPPTDVYVDDVKPWLDPISHVISGSKLGDDSYMFRFVIGVE